MQEKAGNLSPNILDQVLAHRKRVTERLAHIRHVVAVMSGKGGVGKSALTANLAAIFGNRGWAVGVLDADINGSSAAAMLGARGQTIWIGPDGVQPAVGVADVRVMAMDLFLDNDDQPVEWKHPGGLAEDRFAWQGLLEANILREYLSDTNWGNLDLLLIDMPPGTDRLDTLIRFVPRLSGALIVTIPSQVAYLVVRRAIQSARQAGVPLLGLVENMVSHGEQELSGERFAAEVKVPFLGAVPRDPRLAIATDAGRPFVLTDAGTVTCQAIHAVAEKLEMALYEIPV